MIKFVIGSISERKIKTAQEVIFDLFKDRRAIVEGYASFSGMPETPYGRQTFDGARNRALNSRSHIIADFYIGLESGLIERYGDTYEEAWAAVIEKEGKEFFGYSSGLKVPDLVLDKMKKSKMEHSDVMAMIEKEYGKTPNDTWGIYSGGMITRVTSLKESLRNALIQIVAEDGFYKDNKIKKL